MKSPNLFFQINPHTQGQPEVPAQFPGGIPAMYTFIRKELHYPFLALEEGLEGTVLIGFTVATDGSIASPKIINSLDFDCDDEAMRIIRLMPKWTPAQNRGTTVPVQVVLPVQFQLVPALV